MYSVLKDCGFSAWLLSNTKLHNMWYLNLHTANKQA